MFNHLNRLFLYSFAYLYIPLFMFLYLFIHYTNYLFGYTFIYLSNEIFIKGLFYIFIFVYTGKRRFMLDFYCWHIEAKGGKEHS